MTNDFYSFEWVNIDQFINLFDEMNDRFLTILAEEMNKYGITVEEGMKALSPHDHGDLEESLHVTPAKKTNVGVEMEGGSNLEYAFRREVEPARSGVHPKYENGAKFPEYYVKGRGARTRSKPAWRGEKAGRRYVTRAVKLTDKDWEEMGERVLTRVISEGLI